jgi:hypothetical protein
MSYPDFISPESCLDDLRRLLTISGPEECRSRRDLKEGTDGRGKQLLLFAFTLPFILSSLSNNWDLQVFLVSIFSSQ